MLVMFFKNCKKTLLSVATPCERVWPISAQANIRVVWGGARRFSGGSQVSIAISILDRPALHAALLDSVLGRVSPLNKSKSLWGTQLGYVLVQHFGQVFGL